MSRQVVSVVSTGVANVASVLAAFRRLGSEPLEIDTPDAIRSAENLVLPGVGAFAAAMQALQARGLVEPLCERIRKGRPTLAICLGLQLFSAESEESLGVAGLGLWPDRVLRLRSQRVPQLGWNRVNAAKDSRYLENGYAYYANSYCLEAEPLGWKASWSNHDGNLIAAVERDGVLACQFHPELSGAWGEDLLRRWLENAKC